MADTSYLDQQCHYLTYPQDSGIYDGKNCNIRSFQKWLPDEPSDSCQTQSMLIKNIILKLKVRRCKSHSKEMEAFLLALH